ncbi:MAG: hypothetical protein D6795_05275 [Deltaproteobacteria bacterium]|nr:MAG: hypothetical protein D6795_05275 [Deltaproteobacteria bacterium]
MRSFPPQRGFVLPLLLFLVACESRPSSPPPRGEVQRPVLRRNLDAVSFTPEEEAMIETIARLYRGLAKHFTTFETARIPEEATIAQLAGYMKARLPEISGWTARYRALPQKRREALHRAVFERHEEEVVTFVKAGSRWSTALREPERIERYRQVIRTILAPWAKADALWVFEGFGEEAVRELREVALGEVGKEREAEEKRRTAAP